MESTYLSWSPPGVHLESIRSPSGVSGLYQDVWGSVTYSPGSERVSLHSNMPNKMWFHSKHITYISMVQKSSVHTCQIGQIKWHCTPNIYPGYQWFRKGQFTHVKHAKWNVIALRTYTLYTDGSEIIGLHISNMSDKMLWHTEHIAYIPMVQKSQFAHSFLFLAWNGNCGGN